MKNIESNLKKQKIIILVLCILLIIAGCYIIISKIKQEVYQAGLEEGYEQAVIQIMQYTATCQQLPVSYGNQTITLVAVECLQSEASS